MDKISTNYIRLILVTAFFICVPLCVAAVTYIGVLDNVYIAKSSDYLVKLVHNLKYVGAVICVITSFIVGGGSLLAFVGSYVPD